LAEYTTVIKRLLESPDAVSYEGRYYKVSNLRFTPPVPAALRPGYLISGSSDAGLQTALSLDATPVEYPKPVAEYAPRAAAGRSPGMRIGIIARKQSDKAWEVARARFPVDRRGQLTHQLAMKMSDSSWHQQLSELGRAETGPASPYWLVPFENYHTFCPY